MPAVNQPREFGFFGLLLLLIAACLGMRRLVVVGLLAYFVW